MQKITVQKIKALKGAMIVPGDKSISHRAIMLASIAKGKSVVVNFLESEDCLNTKKAFQRMGIKFSRRGKALIVHGQGLYGLTPPKKPLDCGNSGTTIRLISGILAGQKFTTTLTGDKYLRKRPMSRIVVPLTQMGAKIKTVKSEFAPLSITGGNLKAVTYTLPVASAQVKSCLLLAGLYAQGQTTVIEPVPTRDHTERMLKYLGAIVQKNKLKITVQGGPKLRGKKIIVPGDISSASFFIVAACIIPGSKIIIRNVGVNPTRMGIVDILKQMGARITMTNLRCYGEEPVADLAITSSVLKGVKIRGQIIANIIDEIPILTVAAMAAQGQTVIEGAKELRVKETDRIKSMASQLSKMGVKIQELADGLVITGLAPLHGATVNSFGDHRTAMSLAIAGLIAEGRTEILDTDCIKTSFPNFMTLLRQLGKGRL